MVKGVAISTIAVAVLMGGLVACSETTEVVAPTLESIPSLTPESELLASEEVESESVAEVEEDDQTDDLHETDDEHQIALEATYLGSYLINDEAYGTQTTVTVSNGTRTILTNALPNHDTGDFPNSGNPNTITAQSVTYTYTTRPVYTGSSKEIRIAGVAVNGIKLEPGTAETVNCNSGETYRVEGLQNSFNLGMDFNNAHVQPNGEYHYHGLSDLLVNESKISGGDLVHIGFAADGHLILSSTTGAYLSGYELGTEARSGTNCTLSLGRNGGKSVTVEGTIPDGTYTSDWIYKGSGNLDECNGAIINGEYSYVITVGFPYIPRCLMGEFTERKRP